MDLVEEDILMHYGVKRRSGRYPWGSGDNPYQHGGDFLARVEELQRLGKTEKQIADELHLSTTDLRMQVRVAKHERRALQADRARSLREDGKTLDEIASILGYANDSSVRALLNENTAANKNKAQATAEILKRELAEKGAIDVGTGVERQLGVSTGVLQEALFILETEGYNRYGVGVPQVNDPKKRTITPVISVPEIDQREVYQNLDLVKSVGDYHSTDGGESWDKREYPASIDSSRVKILYGDEGGALKDGVIEIRRGVADLDLGDSHYAQVRILVDGTHYLKGMAMYSDDMPDGADIVFNTNKHTDMLVCFGGDGTILHASKLATAHNLPILGINIGTMGFIAELEAGELELLRRLPAGDYTIEPRSMIDVTVTGANGQRLLHETALNDAVVTKGAIARVVQVSVYCDNVEATSFSGDGVIIATPTGSTAYSMSAGGPIVEPLAKNLIISPICAHAMLAKTIVVSPERVISIKIGKIGRHNAYLSVDGGRAFRLNTGDVITTKASQKVTKLVRLKQTSFFEILNKKFIDRQR